MILSNKFTKKYSSKLVTHFKKKIEMKDGGPICYGFFFESPRIKKIVKNKRT